VKRFKNGADEKKKERENADISSEGNIHPKAIKKYFEYFTNS
jgi:hypothetical protein